MKTFKIVLALALFGMVVMAKSVKAEKESIFDGWIYTDVTASSATIFSGAGRVKALYASTDTAIGANYFILCDTPAVTLGLVGSAPFAQAVRKSPALYFASTGTVNVQAAQYPIKAMDYGEDGTFISSACFLFKSAAASGEAIHVGVLWRK